MCINHHGAATSNEPSSISISRCCDRRGQACCLDLLNWQRSFSFPGNCMATYVSCAGGTLSAKTGIAAGRLWRVEPSRCARVCEVEWMQYDGSDMLLPVVGTVPEIHKKHSCFQEAGVNELALKKLLNGTKKKAGGWSCLNPGKKPPPSFVQNIRHPKRRELSRPNNERSLSGRHCISVPSSTSS